MKPFSLQRETKVGSKNPETIVYTMSIKQITRLYLSRQCPINLRCYISAAYKRHSAWCGLASKKIESVILGVIKMVIRWYIGRGRMGLNFSFSMKSPAEVSITVGFAIKMLSSTRRAIPTLTVSSYRDDRVAIYV